LGLSIAKGFIEAHNGKIKLENNKEGGAKFTIDNSC
jgi:two-component system sensor histidine kinase KdpD